MRLIIREQSLWDLAEELGADHGKPFERVLAEIATRMHDGEIPAKYPDAPDEWWREWLQHIARMADEARILGVRLERQALPFWNRIVARTEVVEQCLLNRPPAKPIGDRSLLRAGEPAAVGKRSRGKPGPKPLKRAGIAEKMLNDLCSGRRTTSDLDADTLTALTAQYSGSPNTAGLARQDALSQFSEFQN